MNKIPVLLGTQNAHEICVGTHCLDQFLEELNSFKLGKNILILTHPSIQKLYGDHLRNLLAARYRCELMTVPEGESSKGFTTLHSILDTLLEYHFERNDTLISLGGGVIGDLGGFAASIYLRGINFIQCPTTLLAQVDAAIGGKTGINHSKGKNLIGSFYQPRMTFIDTAMLSTLPQAELLSGLAEVVKYGVIMNPDLFNYLEERATRFSQLSPENHPEEWTHIIEESCKNKADVVSKDAKESQLRAILNFGHTIGHAIEAVTDYGSYSHGQAVAIGMKAALQISVQLNLIPEKKAQRVQHLLEKLGFQLFVRNISKEDLKKPIKLDKKVKNGKVRFILATDIGKVVITDDVPDRVLDSALESILS